MAYIAKNAETYLGKTVGDGHCVTFVSQISGVPNTSLWQQGNKVKGATLVEGTAIATFVNGTYPNNTTGNHAAIYIRQDSSGINVWDQWVGQPVHKRLISFKNGQGSLSNDGDAFYVIE